MRITPTSHDGWGLSWVAAEPALMRRCSHALPGPDGGVWLVEPVDGEGLDDALGALGEVRGVVQLVDRHNRDSAALAARYGVPLLRLPQEGVPELGAEAVVLYDRPWWREVALRIPDRRALVVGEAVGTAPYFTAGGRRVGLHPLARLSPPQALAGLAPELLLVGHGAPLGGPGIGAELDDALARGRRELPRAWGSAARSLLAGR